MDRVGESSFAGRPPAAQRPPTRSRPRARPSVASGWRWRCDQARHSFRARQVVGIDHHEVNGGLIDDGGATGLPAGGADVVVFSPSMESTPEDRLGYLREA